MDVHLENKRTKKQLTNEQVKKLILQSQQGSKKARDMLVERNVRLVWSVVQRFLNRGYEPDDLFQIGSIGLMKAIDKFDLSYDVRFSTYAVPMIIGEIQRFLRDDGTIKVSRSLKEIANKVRIKRDELTKAYDRSPTISEIADSLDISTEDAIYALEAVKYPQSIHDTVFENDGDPITLLDQLTANEANWFNQMFLEDAIRTLGERERLIIYLRYYKDQTQAKVAERLDISQVQVSRLEKRIFEKLKTYMHK